jgi:hypothetical protein
MVLCLVAYESRYVIAATHRMTTSVLFLALTRTYPYCFAARSSTDFDYDIMRSPLTTSQMIQGAGERVFCF